MKRYYPAAPTTRAIAGRLSNPLLLLMLLLLMLLLRAGERGHLHTFRIRESGDDVAQSAQ
jgi:hypothetical protein